MMTLIYLVRRRPDLDAASFRSAWAERHQTLGERLRRETGAIGYRAHFRAESVCNECIRSGRGLGSADYDAVLEMTWPSLAAYQQGFGAPAGLKLVEDMIDAERRFVDFRRSAAFVADTSEVLAATSVDKRRRAHSKVVLRNETSPSDLMSPAVSG